MEITKLSIGAIIELIIEAYDHLFFATDFQENLKRVQDFENRLPFSFLYESRILSYLEYISGGIGYPDFIARNVSEYVLFLRDSVKNLSPENKKISFELANQIIVQNRIYRSNPSYERFYQIRFSECTSLFEFVKAYFEKTEVIEKHIKEFVPSLFLYSCQLLDGNHTILNPNQFLSYCQYLMHIKSSLLDDTMFYNSFLSTIESLPEQDFKKLKR